jgi:alcohol dehydrogenase
LEQFFYQLPVPVDFGVGKRHRLAQLLGHMNLRQGILISAPSMVRSGMARELIDASDGRLVTVFSDIHPNPTVVQTDRCAQVIREHHCQFAVALGGGSIIDCAKAACFLARKQGSMAEFLDDRQSIDVRGIPLIAMPTTAGTASEITGASVLTDTVKGVKVLLTSDRLYPDYALIDPELTYTCPPTVTAASGLDVLAHALEAFYGRRHQPFTDMAAEQAARLVFHFLLTAYHEPDNQEARDGMCLASVTAGLAFGQTATAAAHACSYPLTQNYGIPHGEACALTLPSFWKLNGSRQNPERSRLHAFSNRLGFKDTEKLASRIDQMKSEMGMRMTLAEVGVRNEQQLDKLVADSFAPNIQNNPVRITRETLKSMYLKLYSESASSV